MTTYEIGTRADRLGHHGYVKVFENGRFLWSKKCPVAMIEEQDAYENAMKLRNEITGGTK